ncbi:MAG: T9SS type A sorting domain-containing protein [Bacteroidales bacterium]|nr:T9SS type A sorting domain-containing protein [Bacteroidales bacterium]
MKNNIINISLILIFSFSCYSQETLVGLQTNPVITNYLKNNKNVITRGKRAATIKPVYLPFVDDFSKDNIYPDSSLWLDSCAFINRDLGKNPVTLGVATFDALDKNGKLYDNASSTSEVSDYLTSKPIRLDSTNELPPQPINVSDSVYFSFYYQPQGNSDNSPEPGDSLVLEFFSPVDTTWKTVWSSAGGMTYQQFYNIYQKSFRLIMLPVRDSIYFKNGFKFRFKNYASVANSYEPSWASGIVDQWNIDYVYMNKGRTIGDTIFDDVAFVDKIGSLLNDYQSMPWDHFKADSTGKIVDALNIVYKNLSDSTKNVKRDFVITDLSGSTLPYNYTGGNLNISPFSEEIFTVPIKNYSLTLNSYDTTTLEVEASVNTTPDDNGNNDTVKARQVFSDYYAYDDGVPEAGWGLTGSNAKKGKAACKFILNKSDTLKEVQIYFNRTLNEANKKMFYLGIWTSLVPENVVYKSNSPVPFPEFEDSLNEFHTYYLETPLYCSGTIYIGWYQTTNDNLNMGFDLNNEFGWSGTYNGNLFYNTDGTWQNSSYKGALMMRPVFKKVIPQAVENNDFKNNILVYPNPAKDFINIKNETNEKKLRIVIFDFLGRERINSIINTDSGNTKINLNDFGEGLYIIQISDLNGKILKNSKFVVLK